MAAIRKLDNGHALTSGSICGEKLEFPGGRVEYSIWTPLGEDDNTGLCFDFPASALDGLMELLKALEDSAPIPIAEAYPDSSEE